MLMHNQKMPIIVLSLFMLVSSAQAAKKSITRNVAEAELEIEPVVSNKKEPLRNIARESSKGRQLSNKEQAIFLEENLDDTSDDVSMIRYTITVFKDKTKYSMGDWDQATRSTVKRFKDVSAHHNDWVEDVIDDIRTSLHKAFDPNAPRSGIHAEVSIKMSSGEQPSDCKCGPKCSCAVRYAGNCPCSLETPRAHPAEVKVCCVDRKK